MNRITLGITLALASVALSGCFTTRIYAQARTGGRVSQVEEEWHHIAIFGLVELSDAIALDRVCPEGVAHIDQEETFLNGLVSSICQGLYNPQTVTVYCVDGRSARLTLDEGGQVTVLPSPS